MAKRKSTKPRRVYSDDELYQIYSDTYDKQAALVRKHGFAPDEDKMRKLEFKTNLVAHKNFLKEKGNGKRTSVANIAKSIANESVYKYSKKSAMTLREAMANQGYEKISLIQARVQGFRGTDFEKEVSKKYAEMTADSQYWIDGDPNRVDTYRLGKIIGQIYYGSE